MKQTKVAIVGAGPIGIELAVALKTAGIDYIHFEAGQIGSTINWYAPGTLFFSSPERIAIAGVPLANLNQTKATKEEYLNYLRLVIRQFNLSIKTYERVDKIAPRDGGFLIQTSASSCGVGEHAAQALPQIGQLGKARAINEIQAQKVVLAIGDMHRPRLLGIPGESLGHVSHYFKDPHSYFGKKVAIVGGKNSAAEAALRLFRIGCSVTLIYRGAELDKTRIKYWIYPELKKLLETGKIKFLAGCTPTEIQEQLIFVKAVDSQGNPVRDAAPQEVDGDFVLLLTGYVQDSSLFQMTGVNMTGPGNKPSFNPQTMETNVPGLYVAGTGAAGTQLGGVKEFIETGHVHIPRIVNSILGKAPPVEDAPTEFAALES